MDCDEFERLQGLSIALAGNNVLLPVAAVIAQRGETGPVSTPIVSQLLEGRLHANRITKELVRLDRLGALAELPFPGRPHARMFDVTTGPFWTVVCGWALDPQVRLRGG